MFKLHGQWEPCYGSPGRLMQRLPPMKLTWENPAHQTCSRPGRTHRHQESTDPVPRGGRVGSGAPLGSGLSLCPTLPCPRDHTDWDARRPSPGSPLSPGPHLGSGMMPAFPGEGRQGTCPRGRRKSPTCQMRTVARRARVWPAVRAEPEGLPPHGGESRAR